MTDKTLKDFFEVYKPKSPDEQKFVDKHVTIKHKDRNGNGDDVFNAANIKTIKRKEERHGYDSGEDEKVYEEVEDLDELSQKMVRAYRDKARDDKESAEDDREYNKAHDDNTDDEDKKIGKRTAGIKMASSKIHGGAKVKVTEDINIDDLLDEALDLLNSIDEKKLTPAEMKKREEVVKAIKRENPKMDKSMAYAVATKTAKRVAEEAEELEELSSDTVKSYMGKAMGDAVQKTQAQQKKKYASDIKADQKGIDKRVRGLAMAKKKMAAEEVEAIDELSKDTLSNYADKASDARGHAKLPTKKVDNRYKGVATAAKKLAKEEVEQVDELSKPTMGRYINRAKDVIDSASYRQGHRDSRGDGGNNPVAKGIEKKLSKRHKGIETAVKKLTKEDIINRAISKFVSEDHELPSIDDRFLNAIDHLPESHIATLFGLFDSLSEENQLIMIDTVGTTEGVNSLIDFAIENQRGE
jgi:hypothetical protein